MLKKLFIIPIVILSVMALFGFMMLLNIRGDNKDFATEGSKIIIVKQGMSTADIAELLHDKKLVKDPQAFRWEARWKGLARKLQAGPYHIEAGLSNAQIVDTMAKGLTKEVRFAIPEGFTVVKIAAKLEKEGICSAEKFIQAATAYAPYEYMQTNDPNVVFKAEGFIYPATYDLPLGISEEEILKIFVDQFDNVIKSSGLEKEITDSGKRVRDVVNLAAMVEQEAVFVDEQPRIAGVFLKRLDIGMPIQSDTTIQYIMAAHKEIVTFADTRIESPYNTYQNAGLPPGPIGSPSLNAIKAVLYPEEHEFLYFVAEKDGHHRFTKTYAEHLAAIEKIG